ncbi:hypothetical protein GCK72_012573 [Caenorhabditis remanei]|uniref:Fibronectin type-III domain-containing protein n=1 Tax=Caenorhabditis remanei TaxID=31234 RepID=A0A6A5GLD5_CAERE|nr:hypothetical protein GCK72_012573 [Caenorhabditis remanei]KAF1756120.1 hypothetical protein GCK72_012573 [Caenorhabditis remanei]
MMHIKTRPIDFEIKIPHPFASFDSYLVRVRIDSEDRAAPPPAPHGRFSHEDSGIPSAPGVPDVVDAGIGEVTVVWSAPLQKNGGEIRGYQLQMRELPDGEWEDMGVDQLIKDTSCREGRHYEVCTML